MKTFYHVLGYLTLIPLFAGCISRTVVMQNEVIEEVDIETPIVQNEEIEKVVKEVPTYCLKEVPIFCATSGPVAYKDVSVGWINTCGGSIQLNRVFVNQNVFTDENLTADNSKLGSFCIGGDLWLINCVIDFTSKTEGEAWIEGSAFHGQLQISGPLNSHQSAFYDDVIVQDYVSAQGSIFHATLQANAKMVHLDHVCLNNIIVCPAGDDYDLQVIVIKNHSEVLGNIYFPSGRGKIILDQTSHIYGQIYGGNIIDPSK